MQRRRRTRSGRGRLAAHHPVIPVPGRERVRVRDGAPPWRSAAEARPASARREWPRRPICAVALGQLTMSAPASAAFIIAPNDKSNATVGASAAAALAAAAARCRRGRRARSAGGGSARSRRTAPSANASTRTTAFACCSSSLAAFGAAAIARLRSLAEAANARKTKTSRPASLSAPPRGHRGRSARAARRGRPRAARHAAAPRNRRRPPRRRRRSSAAVGGGASRAPRERLGRDGLQPARRLSRLDAVHLGAARERGLAHAAAQQQRAHARRVRRDSTDREPSSAIDAFFSAPTGSAAAAARARRARASARGDALLVMAARHKRQCTPPCAAQAATSASPRCAARVEPNDEVSGAELRRVYPPLSPTASHEKATDG